MCDNIKQTVIIYILWTGPRGILCSILSSLRLLGAPPEGPPSDGCPTAPSPALRPRTAVSVLSPVRTQKRMPAAFRGVSTQLFSGSSRWKRYTRALSFRALELNLEQWQNLRGSETLDLKASDPGSVETGCGSRAFAQNVVTTSSPLAPQARPNARETLLTNTRDHQSLVTSASSQQVSLCP
jgi:hypothetical protein